MIGVALKGLLGRKLRAILTGFAIVLGVAMISGAFVLTDTLGKSFGGIYADSYKATDAVISSKQAIKTAEGSKEAPAFSAAVLERSPEPARRSSRAGRDRGRVETRRRGRQGDRKQNNGLAIGVDPESRPEPESDPARQRALAPRRRPDRDRQVDRRKARLRSRPDRRCVRRRPAGEVQVSGIVGFGSGGSIAGSTITVYDLATAQKLFDKRGKFDVIRVGAKRRVGRASWSGRSPVALRRRRR